MAINPYLVNRKNDSGSSGSSGKSSLPPRSMGADASKVPGTGKSPADIVRNPYYRETDKFSSVGSYGSSKAPAKSSSAAPKAKAKPASPVPPKPKAKPVTPAKAATSASNFKGNWKGAAASPKLSQKERFSRREK